MKIQAFAALAVVAALLPITNCAPSPKPEEEEDRSCEKRDADAKQVVSSMRSLKAFFKPISAPCFYLKKIKTRGDCIYNFGEVIGKCISEDCQHPSSPLYNKTLNVPGGKDGEKENKEKAAGDGEKKKEDNEGVTEKENEEGGKNEGTEDLKTEEPQVEHGENIKPEKEQSRNAYVGGGSIF
ncbi:secreted protein, putative [Ixodes scapularis]|uniref:Secreted protein, putative n=1 Tax=Ixodes scapularis TaxID=6945 RepID=B7PAT2_IXOSC|nr:secreted protein, putative [Ixodes scapularis]|eukprot:XP_002407161.1 secreted protein, putative [Ixodes scapularis]